MWLWDGWLLASQEGCELAEGLSAQKESVASGIPGRWQILAAEVPLNESLL